MVHDITLDKPIEFLKNIEFDGNGHTIKCGSEMDDYFIRIQAGVPCFENVIIDADGKAKIGVLAEYSNPLFKNVTIKNCADVGILSHSSGNPDHPVFIEDVKISNCVNGSIAITGGAVFNISGTNILPGGTAKGAEGQSIFASFMHHEYGYGAPDHITIISEEEYTKIFKSYLMKKGEGHQDDDYKPMPCWTQDQSLINSAILTVDGVPHLEFYSLNKNTIGENSYIKLLRDVEIDTTIHLVFVGKPYTFDGDGHTISPSSKFTRNNKNLQFLIDLDRNFDTNQSALDENGQRRNLITLKNLTLDNDGRAYGLNTWYANIDISNVTILDSKTVGFSVYTGSNITAENLTIKGSEMLGMLVKMGATFEGNEVHITGSKLRGIDMYHDMLKLTKSEVEAGNIGILGYGTNGEPVPDLSVAKWYNVNYWLPQDTNTIFVTDTQPTHHVDGTPIRQGMIEKLNDGQWRYATTTFPESTEIINTIELDNTTVIGGTAIEVKQTNLDINDSEIIATAAPAIFHNNMFNARTTFGYALAMTSFDTKDPDIHAAGMITASNSSFSGLIGIRKANDYDMAAVNTDTAYIKLDDTCVFDAALPTTQYLANKDRIFVANDSTEYPYKLAEKQVKNSAVNAEVDQVITTDTTGKTEAAAEQMNVMNDLLQLAVDASKQKIEIQEMTSTEQIAASPDGKAAAEPIGDAVEKSSIAPCSIVEFGAMAASISNDETIITDDVKTEAAKKLGIAADNVIIEVQPGIDIQVVDFDDSDDVPVITVDIEPVYQLVAKTEDGQQSKPIGEKQTMSFAGTNVKVSIPLPAVFEAEVGDRFIVKHVKDNGTTHEYDATVVKVGALLYAEFENANGFSQFTLEKFEAPDLTNSELKTDRVEFVEENIPEALANKCLDSVEKIEAAMTDVVEDYVAAETILGSALYETTLMYKDAKSGIWKEVIEDYFSNNVKLTVKLEVPAGSDPEKHVYTVVHMFTSSKFGQVGSTETFPNLESKLGSDGKYYIEFEVTSLSPIMVAWTEKPAEEEPATNYTTLLLMKLFMQRFEFTVTASEGGSITTDHEGEIRYGQKITYTITPDEGYAIADVLINGESIGAVSEYTFSRFKKDQTIEAIFVALP